MKKTVISLIILNMLFGGDLDQQLKVAGGNAHQIKKAISGVPKEQLAGMEWLIRNMQKEDLRSLSAEFLLTNCELAYDVWQNNKWGKKIPEDIFLNFLLPYVSLNERRDNWRQDFHNRFSTIIKNTSSIYDAVALLNQNIYDNVGVIYSTDRPKADQSPYESIDAGMASCTGLSILLIDACRSVGIPARFVGTPLWYNNSGNHSWVEIWDDEWHFTGAAEPTGEKLNEVWFSDLASKAVQGDMTYGIFAATWEKTDIYFPMNWLPQVKTYNAIDVTARYKLEEVETVLIPIRVRALDSSGQRCEVRVTVIGDDNSIKEGFSKDKTCDANDHLTFMLPKGKTFKVQSKEVEKTIKVVNEELIDLKL